MAIIQSGASVDLLTVDPTSKAARATLYDATGRELVPAVTGSYIAPIEVRHTSAAAAGQTVFNMRGPATAKAYIRRIWGVMGFDGTALAASGTLRYGLYLGSGAANASGGASIVAQKKRSTFGNSALQNLQIDATGAGLTTAGITYSANPFATFGLPVVSVQVAAPTTSGSPGAVLPFEIDFRKLAERDDMIELLTGDHLAIRLQTVAAIIGLSLTGFIEWDEKA